MKYKHTRLLLLSTIVLASPASAAPYTWDADGSTSALINGAGSWNATGGTNWWNGSTYGAWGNTTADEAIFGVNTVGSGAAGTITVGTVNTNKITFNAAESGNYTLSSGTITLGGTTPTLAANVDATINSVLAGTGGWTKSGSEKLTLGGVNSIKGNFKIANGTVEVASTGKLGSSASFDGTSVITIGNGISGSGKLMLSTWGYNTLGGFGQLDLGSDRLVLDNGIIEYTGVNGGGQRAFKVAANGGTLLSNGSSGVWTVGGTANATYNQIPTTTGILTLAGSNSADLKSYVTGTGAIAKDGANTWVFGTATSENNSYSGNTTVHNGTLQLRAGSSSVAIPNGAGKGNVILNSPGILDLNTRSITINGLSGTGTVTSSAAGALTLTAGANDQTSSFGGVIQNGSGTVALTKTGNGTITLSGDNNYTGATDVTAGVLAVTGSLANTTTTVSGTGTLKGSGTIGGSVTINSGGTLASGTSIESLATGALSFTTGSNFQYELDKDATANVAGDLTAVTGNLSLNGTVNLSFLETGTGNWQLGSPLGDHFGSPAADKLTLISYTGIWNGGLFTYGGKTIADDSAIVINGQQWWFNYNDTDAGTNFIGDLTGTRFVTMTVPEPSAALLGGLGLLAWLRRRRG